MDPVTYKPIKGIFTSFNPKTSTSPTVTIKTLCKEGGRSLLGADDCIDFKPRKVMIHIVLEVSDSITFSRKLEAVQTLRQGRNVRRCELAVELARAYEKLSKVRFLC